MSLELLKNRLQLISRLAESVTEDMHIPLLSNRKSLDMAMHWNYNKAFLMME